MGGQLSNPVRTTYHVRKVTSPGPTNPVVRTMDQAPDTMRPCLKPLREAKAGEEFCFDYKLDEAEHTVTVEDHDTVGQL